MNIPAARAAVDKEWDTISQTLPAWDISKFRDKADVARESQAQKMPVHYFDVLFATLHTQSRQHILKHTKYESCFSEMSKTMSGAMRCSLNKVEQLLK